MSPAAQLFCGDALATLQSLPTGSVDALVTDPPYSSGGMVRGDRILEAGTKYVGFGSSHAAYSDFTGDTRDQRAYGYWCALWLAECLRIVRPGGVALLFSDWRQLPTTTDALQSGGWIWRGVVPWVKSSVRPHNGRFAAACEYVVWGSHGPMPTADAAPCLPGFYHCGFPRNREHMTQKPVELMRALVRIVPEHSVVLDPFMGSGTTGVAALLEGRRFVGIELQESHFATASARIGEVQGCWRERDNQMALEIGA